MTATPTLVVELIADVRPGRVGITITSADAATVTLTRVTADGRMVLVNGRNYPIAGATYIEDYTPPFGVPIQYVAVAKDAAGVESSPSALSAPVTVAESGSGAWLSDPAIPGSDVEFRVAAWDEKDFDTQSESLLPLGGRLPVALLAPRQAATFTLITKEVDREGRRALRSLFDTAPMLLLRPSPVLDEPARYVMVGRLREQRITVGRWRFELPLTESAPIAVATRYGEVGKRYQDLPQHYSSYSDPALTSRTYIDLAKDPRP